MEVGSLLLLSVTHPRMIKQTNKTFIVEIQNELN